MHLGLGHNVSVDSDGHLELRSNNSKASFFNRLSQRDEPLPEIKPKFVTDKYMLKMFNNGGEKTCYTEKQI